MEKEEIKKRSEKYLNGSATDKEKAMLEAWYLELGEGAVEVPEERIREIGREIFKELPGNDKRKFQTGILIAAAAIAVIMVGLVLELVFHKPDLVVQNTSHDLPPGGNRATLTLANGKIVDLSIAENGKLAEQPGANISKSGAGQLVYRDESPDGRNMPEVQNTIATPVGGIWQLSLPDGTKVWLNNSSSLTYPTSFRGQMLRKVVLSGEAYFEVAKDKAHPFVVSSNWQEVKVLGTHFNIRAFKEDRLISTTLLEGRVSVSSIDNHFHRLLLPGQQGRLSGNGLAVAEVDTGMVLSWKNGYFRFDHTPVEQIMRELSRWYGIDVIYAEPLRFEGLTGRISRSKNISQVLNALEGTKTIHFKVEGRRVTVMQ